MPQEFSSYMLDSLCRHTVPCRVKEHAIGAHNKFCLKSYIKGHRNGQLSSLAKWAMKKVAHAQPQKEETFQIQSHLRIHHNVKKWVPTDRAFRQ